MVLRLDYTIVRKLKSVQLCIGQHFLSMPPRVWSTAFPWWTSQMKALPYLFGVPHQGVQAMSSQNTQNNCGGWEPSILQSSKEDCQPSSPLRIGMATAEKTDWESKSNVSNLIFNSLAFHELSLAYSDATYHAGRNSNRFRH
jgi:hypothetical protein